MPSKHTVVALVAFGLLGLTACGVSDTQPPVEASDTGGTSTIEDVAWNQLVSRSQQCGLRGSTLLKVTMQSGSPQKVKAIHAKTSDSTQFVSVFPRYGENPVVPTQAYYYIPGDARRITYTTVVGKDHATMDYSSGPEEVRERTITGQNFLRQALDTAGCP